MQKIGSAQRRFFCVKFNEDDAFAGDVEFDLRIAHGYCTKVID
jgi:acyl dehydratase